VSLLLALAAGEIVVRATCGVPLRERLPIVEVRASARRGYEMVPDRDHYTYEHPVHVNHLGLRGPDLGRKLPGEYRILCLGDSTTYGQGVADEDTIPTCLEAELARLAPSSARRVRVVNGGVRGYGTRQELGLLEEVGPAIEPDLVLLLWYPNDLERPDLDSIRAKLERSGPVAFDTGMRMEGAGLALWAVRRIVRGSALVVKARHWIADLAYHRLTADEVEQGFRRFDEDLSAARPLLEVLRSKLVVAVIPASESLRGEDRDAGLHSRVGDLARAHGFDCVDLTPALRDLAGRSPTLPILPYDGHYTGEANREMARVLAARIAARI
jgi:lysophospholipase L1-like esterase